MKQDNRGMSPDRKGGNTPKSQGSGRRGKEEPHGAVLRGQTAQTGMGGTDARPGPDEKKAGREGRVGGMDSPISDVPGKGFGNRPDEKID